MASSPSPNRLETGFGRFAIRTPNAANPLSSQPQTTTKVVNAVREAADATGVPFKFLLAQASKESNLDPSANNKRSSAVGLFQFTQNTWLSVMKRHAADVGRPELASAITRGRDGKFHVADPAKRKEILDLRRDPAMSARMAAEYAKENQKTLSAKLGREISPQDLYLAHFLGAAGAAKVLQQLEHDDAGQLLPEAARANPEIFNRPGTQEARSVASLYKAVQSRFAAALGHAGSTVNQATRADLAQVTPKPRPETAQPEQVASAAPIDQPSDAVQPTSPYFPVRIPPAKVTKG